MRIEILLTIVGMGVVTYFTRVLFMLTIDEKKLPQFFSRWLKFVPVAVLTSIIAPIIAAPEKKLDLTFANPYFIAGIATVIVAGISRNLLLTVFSGIGFILLFKYLIG